MAEAETKNHSNLPKYVTITILVAFFFLAGNLSMTTIKKSIDNSNSEVHSRQPRSICATDANGASIKLVGNPAVILTEKKGSGYRLVDKWQYDETFHRSSLFTLINSSHVDITIPGVYLIHSQLSWTSRTKTQFAYEIRKETTKGPKGSQVLASCLEYKADKRDNWKQCHTSVTATFNAGDKVAIYLKRENCTIDFYPGKTFFGLTLLQTMPE